MIQAIMLIALGFLAATLLGVLLAPSLWSRAYRLSRKRLEQTLPLTLSEIEATQDQLRASYAARLRRLETALATTKQKAAIQLVDNSRLQMQIVALKDQIGDLDLRLSERRNAAAVLEHTITKRFPEIDAEMATMQAQLQERSYDLQDLRNKLSRREEALAAAEREASSYEEELTRLRQVLEKNSTDRSGRRLRRASQWDLDDYRAEYDRLNLELSKLRQQLAQLQDRDAQQAGLIKGELQKLAELILTSATHRGETRVYDRPEPAKRPPLPDFRRDRPQPWPQAFPLTSALASQISPGMGASPLETSPSDESGAASPAEKPPAPETASRIDNAILASVLDTLPDDGLTASKSDKESIESTSKVALRDIESQPMKQEDSGVKNAAVDTDAPSGTEESGAESVEPASEKVLIEAEDAGAARNGINGFEHIVDGEKEALRGSEIDAGDSAYGSDAGKRRAATQSRTLLDRLRGVSEKTAEAEK